MKTKPQFENYYTGSWPYEQSRGVGLRLSGYPTDIEKFFDLLHQQSCNPIATRRILDELKEKGEKYTTLMYRLNFNYIGDKLAQIGVKMEIVQPAPIKQLQNEMIDNAALALVRDTDAPLHHYELTPEEINEVKSRYSAFQKSLNWFNHHFGPYDENDEISKIHFKISQESYGYKSRKI